MSELPKGWVNAALDDIAIVNPGRIEGLIADTSVSFVPMPAVSEVDGEIVNSTVRPFAEVSKGYTQFQEGDVIFAKITPCMENGKIAVARSLENGVACGSTEFHVVRPLAGTSPDYIWRFLRQNSYRSDAEAVMTGAVGQRRVPAAHLKGSRVPLPPLPEQRRIVAKIDSLTGKSRRARDHLDHIPHLVEKYKQAVLAAAFRGDLTREWRKSNKVADWQKATLGEIVTIASGQTPKGIEGRLSPDGELPWFKVSSMNEPDNLLGLRTSQFRLSRSDARALGLRIVAAGSIAFPKRGGAIATNKKRKLLVDGALDLNLMVLTASDISADFLWWWMQKLDLASISNGSNVPQINNGDISPLPIDVPPSSEQAEIARIVEAAFAWIDRLASEATSAHRLIDRLDQSVLAKAFRGELVPQNPGDEPASVLLDRIKAERGATPKMKRGRKAKAT